MINRSEFVKYLNDTLKPWQIKDYCPNGLQVEGAEYIKKVVTGVTASQALIEAAIEQGADTILVHHGYFWKGEDQTIRGMKKQRLKRLLEHDINLLAYHLPLDIHPQYGNNAQLAKKLGITIEGGLEADIKTSVAMTGRLDKPQSASEFAATIEVVLGRKPLVNSVNSDKIETIALCTGGGQSYIDMAGEQGFDAYLTGEASEKTIHSSREMNIHFFGAGHHATERYGVKSLGEHLAEKFSLEVTFIDIDNPV
jgi:dinuclear metal center YbgI/SA1388 family protein